MPEHARVFLIEDDPTSFSQAEERLKRAGHKVVLSAKSRDEARTQVSSLKKKHIQVAIVDGSLDGSGGVNDGVDVTRRIKAADPDITVIGHATRSDIPGVDFNCPKIDGLNKLNEVVTQA